MPQRHHLNWCGCPSSFGWLTPYFAQIHHFILVTLTRFATPSFTQMCRHSSLFLRIRVNSLCILTFSGLDSLPSCGAISWCHLASSLHLETFCHSYDSSSIFGSSESFFACAFISLFSHAMLHVFFRAVAEFAQTPLVFSHHCPFAQSPFFHLHDCPFMSASSQLFPPLFTYARTRPF